MEQGPRTVANLENLKTERCRFFLAFLGDERAQATTEYILLLSIVALMAKMVFHALAPMVAKLSSVLEDRINNRMKEGALHQYPMPRR